MARPGKPWFRGSKNAWYCTVEGRKVALGVSGRENGDKALQAWHRLMATGSPTPKAEPKPTPEALSVGGLIQAFLADAEGRVKPSTAEAYRTFLKPFLAPFGKVAADRLTPAQAEAFARRPDWSNSTRHDYLAALGRVYR